MMDKIQDFLTQIAPVIKSLSAHRDTSIGFNAFALASDIYYRENFHSDILRAILDPRSNHGEGDLFLRLFIDYLKAVSIKQNKPNLAEDLDKLLLDGVRVVREEGRIDIKIQAQDWIIIIENKINGANDMPRQLPSYVDKCKPGKVKAIVYLTAANEKDPEKNGWLKEDYEKVHPKLLKIVGFSEDTSKINLVDGWLSPCEFAAKGFNTKSILSQYSELVKHQSGETMNDEEVQKLFDALSTHEIAYKGLRAALDAMPHVLANMIVARCKEKKGLKRAWVSNNTVAVFDLSDELMGKDITSPINLAIDIHCENLEKYGISIFSRAGTIVAPKKYEELLQENFDFKYEEDWGRLVLHCDTNEVFRCVDAFVVKIGNLLDFLCKNMSRFAEIASNNA